MTTLIASANTPALPDDGVLTLRGIEISGHRVTGDQCLSGDDAPDVWRVTDDDVDRALHRTLISAYSETGLWPVRGLDTGRMSPAGERHRHEALGRGGLETIRSVFGLDGQYYDEYVPHCVRCGNVPDRTGELAVAASKTDRELLDEILSFGHAEGVSFGRGPRFGGELFLVPTPEPSEAISRIGWIGACNDFWGAGDASIVIQSWQERFGAYLWSAGASTLDLVVTRPPVDIAQARQVAQELLHFCLYDTQFHGRGDVDEYCRSLVNSNWWSFWWD